MLTHKLLKVVFLISCSVACSAQGIKDGCSGCFLHPPGCDRNCKMLATWQSENNTDNIVVELELDTNLQYIAIGFSQGMMTGLASDDDDMGDDLVMYCAKEGGFKFGMCWNYQTTPDCSMKQPSGVVPEGKVDGDKLTCKEVPKILIGNLRRISIEIITMPPSLVGEKPQGGAFKFLLDSFSDILCSTMNYPGQPGPVRTCTYEFRHLTSHQYPVLRDREPTYILLAAGAYDNGLRLHALVDHSEERINLKSTSMVEGEWKPPLKKIHAILMVLVWMGSAGAGIIIARHMKKTWVGSQMCGSAIWFQLHRILMIFTWTATIAATIVIVVDLEGWSRAWSTNPHPILGTITVILVFLQPFLALLRPSPTSSSRWLFNWSHWFIGTVAHSTAMPALFFSLSLPSVGLQGKSIWFMVAYVGLYVLTHLVLAFNTFWAEKKEKDRVAEGEVVEASTSYSPPKDQTGRGFRIVVLANYVLAAIILIIMTVTDIVKGV